MNKVLITGVTAEGFHIAKQSFPLPLEFDDLLAAHGQRLKALLDRPVLVAITWDDGDDVAAATIIDPELAPDALFEVVQLPFPEAA
jgi:hypothetical protein